MIGIFFVLSSNEQLVYPISVVFFADYINIRSSFEIIHEKIDVDFFKDYKKFSPKIILIIQTNDCVWIIFKRFFFFYDR